ncbi:uncharacterized protein LOC105201866 [Solenopsis invicta]|uniref:uncharacterized protein LOC105201866 n=1 Tax=Solenopsis invicta TaxID=13686 RepID=UPI00193E47B3|nr:uncharacterized protein LOC105201866 [Solenopsis invicta]
MMKYTSALVAILAVLGMGLAYPSQDFGTGPQDLPDELIDFVKLIPMDEVKKIITEYVYQDTKVQNALFYILSSDFHSILRKIEVLKEHQALVVYLENAGLPIIESINQLHQIIGMEDYEPPERKLFNSPLKIGDGVKGMLEDVYSVLPISEIVDLHQQKMQNSKVYADFFKQMSSQQTQKLIDDLYANQTFKNSVMTTRENGLELQGVTQLIGSIFGLSFPY